MRLFFLALLCVLIARLLDARTIVVSTNGNDDAKGTPAEPLRTIAKASSLAQAGDTILVRAGIYRERVAPLRSGEANKPITYRGEALGRVFIKGSNVWSPEWKKHADGVYWAMPDPQLFDDDVYVDSANPFLVELSSTPYGRDGKREHERYGTGDPNLVYTCGQVIVGSKPWAQRPYLKEVEKEAKSWTFVRNASDETGRIYVNFGDLDPAKQQVEISTRRRIFAPYTRGLGYIVVEGFVMEHCGNQYPTNFWNTPKWAQAGAVGLRGGHHWIFRNNVVRYVANFAMDVGSGGNNNERDSPKVAGPAASDNLIEKNYFIDNGAAGVVGSTSVRMVVRDNVILRNNTLRFVGKKRYEHGGLKFHYIRDGLIERNYVGNSPVSDGIWLDNQFPDTRVTRNVVIGNGSRGIFLEMSDYKFDRCLVDHNISIGNERIQFYVHDASGSTVMHNLFANSPLESKYSRGAYIYQVTKRTKTGYHSLYNNIFVNHASMLDINYPAHRGGPQRTDHNVYDTSRGDRSFIINSYSDRPSPWKKEDFVALVRKDVAGGDPQAIDGGSKVALNLSEWRQFWSKH
ncbi:MAG: right-handed parallel beta-helix repeat-containing protein, partial [Planctomycetota bacterium]